MDWDEPPVQITLSTYSRGSFSEIAGRKIRKLSTTDSGGQATAEHDELRIGPGRRTCLSWMHGRLSLGPASQRATPQLEGSAEQSLHFPLRIWA